MINEKKICFIICTNDEIALEECLHYISYLIIPDGYEIDCITIQEAECMTQGYNEGMKQSDAKYKVYMHQDVFILNRNFLCDIIDIFKSDKKIGLIGMVGYKRIAPSGIMWTEPRAGEIYNKRFYEKKQGMEGYRYSIEQDSVTCVAEIDGLMMITSVDIEWNTEDLDGWDFYDAYQSINFLEHGYKVVVPNQRIPWCMHDDGVILNLYNYDEYRKKFLKRYHTYLGRSYDMFLGK